LLSTYKWVLTYLHTGEDWYCSAQCATLAGELPDSVHEYARAVTWHGLVDCVTEMLSARPTG